MQGISDKSNFFFKILMLTFFIHVCVRCWRNQIWVLAWPIFFSVRSLRIICSGFVNKFYLCFVLAGSILFIYCSVKFYYLFFFFAFLRCFLESNGPPSLRNTSAKAEKISRMTSIRAKIRERSGDSGVSYEPLQGRDSVPHILNFSDNSMSSLSYVSPFLIISFSTSIWLQRQYVGLRTDPELSGRTGNWQFMPFPVVYGWHYMRVPCSSLLYHVHLV